MVELTLPVEEDAAWLLRARAQQLSTLRNPIDVRFDARWFSSHLNPFPLTVPLLQWSNYPER